MSLRQKKKGVMMQRARLLLVGGVFKIEATCLGESTPIEIVPGLNAPG
jgi:hypothetical protein